MDISKLYDESYAKALAAAQPTTAYTNNITNGNNLYNQLKSEAAQSRSMADANLKKRLSDLNQSSQSLTASNNAAMAGMNDLGNINAQQQGFINQQNALQQQVNLQSQAQAADIYANNYANQSNAELTDANNKFDIYYNLYNNKKITASQFKKLTGIDVKAYSSGGSSSGGNIDAEVSGGIGTAGSTGIGLQKIDTSLNTSDDILTRAYKILLDQQLKGKTSPYKK